MKTKIIFIVFCISFIIFVGCDKEDETINFSDIKDVGLKVSFGTKKQGSLQKLEDPMKYETPENYFVALKSAKLLGTNGTENFILFENNKLSESFIFDYTDTDVVHSLLKDAEIPDGEYSAIEIEIYYLQMNIAIATGDRGIERRNFRIYLSDDAETEEGLHQPGDLTQINDGKEIGWLLGEGQEPNMDPVAPRSAAYTENGDGVNWYEFAGKPGNDYGPFGNTEFMKAPHPVYNVIIGFNFEDNGGDELILDFNVEGCWQFEDKNGDGAFGWTDLDPVIPTKWHMQLPVMTVNLQ